MKKFSEFRHRLTFQTSAEVGDGAGGEVSHWQDAFTVWGLVEPLSGREFFASQQIKKEVSHKVTVRYRPDIVTTMRIKTWDNRILDIEAVLDLGGQRRLLEIPCNEAEPDTEAGA